jgi:hypothetical protein
MKNLWRLPISLALFLTLIVTGCAEESTPLRTTTPIAYQRDFPVTESPFDSDFFAQIAEQLEIVEVSYNQFDRQENVVLNPSQTYRAFTVCDEQCGIYVEQSEDNRLYELRGPFLPWRPFSGLTWLNDNILAFDQWSNPDYGIHYQINFTEGKIESVSAITIGE